MSILLLFYLMIINSFLAGYMLNADPDKRPDIFDVIEEVCKMRNVTSPPRVIIFNSILL